MFITNIYKEKRQTGFNIFIIIKQSCYTYCYSQTLQTQILFMQLLLEFYFEICTTSNQNKNNPSDVNNIKCPDLSGIGQILLDPVLNILVLYDQRHSIFFWKV